MSDIVVIVIESWLGIVVDGFATPVILKQYNPLMYGVVSVNC